MDYPQEYVLINRDNFAESPYVYDVSGEFNTDDALAISFESDDWGMTTVTYFPEKPGTSVSTADNPNYEEGKERAVLGVVLLKLILTGEQLCVEL